MLMMCFIFFGINASDDLSLSSPYWLIGIADSFLSWTNRAAHCVPVLLTCRLGIGAFVSGYNTYGRPCTKVSMLYSLHVEHQFCWFRKKWQRIVVANFFFILCPHPTHHAFPVIVTNGSPGCRSLTHFSVYFRYFWTFSRPEYAWNICTWSLKNHQSINQSVLVITIKLSIHTSFIAGSLCCPYKHRS
jgi:hypothetical protein